MSLVSILNDHFHKKVRVTSHEKKNTRKKSSFSFSQWLFKLLSFVLCKNWKERFSWKGNQKEREIFFPHNGPLFATMEASTHHMFTPQKKCGKKAMEKSAYQMRTRITSSLIYEIKLRDSKAAELKWKWFNILTTLHYRIFSKKRPGRFWNWNRTLLLNPPISAPLYCRLTFIQSIFYIKGYQIAKFDSKWRYSLHISVWKSFRMAHCVVLFHHFTQYFCPNLFWKL